MKASVSGFESLRAGKLRLKEVMIEFLSPFLMSSRFHWPMHGPHALASTVAPTASSDAIWPSRLIVAWICSDPGDTRNGMLIFAPCARACSATSTVRAMSSYDELVQLPTSADVKWSG